MFKKFERAQIGEGVRWLTLLTELIFDGMIVVFLLAFDSEALCVPLFDKNMIESLDDCFGCHSKVLGASSVEQ